MPATPDSESAAEFVATVRTDHVKMKNWYNEHANPQLKQQHGDKYPDLWKEVLNWPGWKDARKAYLKYEQQQMQPQNGGSGGGADEAQADNDVPRKRKSRWGKASNNDPNNNNSFTATTDSSKRSRWGNTGGGVSTANNNDHPIISNNNQYSNNSATSATTTTLPGLMAAGPTSFMSPQQKSELQMELRQINEILDNVEQRATAVDALPRGHRDRSPSPPPIYGPDGKRQNTRAVRWRERYKAQRQDILAKLLNNNGSSTGGGGNSLFIRSKTVKKIPIPIEKHPNYNFIGLIIGPRGKTQKELERKTGCKIAIRGKGSVKEGARGRRDGQPTQGEHEPLHVVISGDDPSAVEAAAVMIQDMLIVIDDEKNVHKQQQLRELALLNGTLKEDEFCTICAEKGHRSFECPRRFANKGAAAASGPGGGGPVVKCAICGDTSHPTRDCKQQATTAVATDAADEDYQKFMAELDGRKKETGAASLSSNNLPPPPPPTGGNLPPPPPAGHLPPPPPVPHRPPPPPVPPAAPTVPPVAAGWGNQQPANGGGGGGWNQQQHQPPPGTGFPPPPPPPPNGNNHHHQQQQQQQPPYNPHQPQAPYNPQQQLHQPPYNPQQQQQQPYQVQPGQETATWDPNAYYGNGGGGAGLNWWEQ